MLPATTLLSATAGDGQVTLTWHEIPGDPSVLGYHLYYDQGGKAPLVDTIGVRRPTITLTRA